MLRAKRGPRRGYAMVLMLSVTMVLSIMAVTLLSSVRSDLAGSRVLQGRSEARALGISTVEFVYASLMNDPDLTALVLSSNPASIPGLPGYNPPSRYGTESAEWAAWSGSGLAPCPSLAVDCLSFTARVDRDEAGQVRGVVLDATARSRCGGVESRCLYSRFQQRLRKAELFDYLFLQQFSALDPMLYPATQLDWAFENCADRYAYRAHEETGATARSPECLVVAYNGEGVSERDVVRGPVYTSDDWVAVCGNPQFLSDVEVSGAGYPPSGASPKVWADIPSLRPGDSCPSTPSDLIPADQQFLLAPLLSLPEPTSAASASEVADPAYVFRPEIPFGEVALNLVTTGSGTSASTTVEVVGAQGVGSDPLPLPRSPAVIVVEGSASVKGTLSGALSIFASENLRIAGNVAYSNGGSRSNSSDVLGLTAGRSVIVNQSSPATDLTVNAIVLATSGSIYVEGWDQSRVGNPDWNVAPTMTFFGAMASKYQGVFAGYLSDTGEVVSGYRKAFEFDDRLKSGLVVPPYLLSLDTQGWIRLPIVEVPVQQG